MIAADVVLVLTGPTAAGKKEAGFAIARRLGAEILSLDSVKLRRGLDIGAAKPTAEDRGDLVIHLMDVAEPAESFSVGRYLELASGAVAAIRARGRVPMFLGGTPLYLNGLLRGLFHGPAADAAIRARHVEAAERDGVESLHARLAAVDPVAAARILPRDLKRISRALEVFELTGEPISTLQARETRRPIVGDFRVVAIDVDDALLDRRLAERVDRMLARGLVDEVRALAARGTLVGESAAAIGYREILEHLAGGMSLADARDAIVRNSRRLVRKQKNWFRRFPEIRRVRREADTTPEALVAAIEAEFTRA